MAAVSASCFTAIGAAFWWQDIQYLRPTPVPKGFRIPAPLEKLPIPAAAKGTALPIALHFYSPGCPCSRFNLNHLREILAKFDQRVVSILVVQGEGDPPSGVDCTWVRDDGSLARAYGVYATPQAVLLRPDGTLVYRGNYNRSRYCEDPATEFMRIAIERELSNQPITQMPKAATISYGCPVRYRGKL